MNELFELGYQLGSAGYPWAKLPPGYTAPEIEPPLPPPQPGTGRDGAIDGRGPAGTLPALPASATPTEEAR
jgi:hypothetical protein